jgi:Flp pilus assembly protein CpaB
VVPLVLAGLGLVLVVAGWTPSPHAAVPLASVPVVVAAHDVDAGAVLTAADLSVVRVGTDGSTLDALRDTAQAIGRRVRVALTRGSPLTGSLLISPIPLQAGHRLVTVHLDSADAPGGVQPGDTADVVAAVADSQGVADGRLLMLASGSVVVASHDSVTLDVDSVDAARVLWGQAFAKSIRVMLRPPGDAAALPEVTASGGVAP